MHFGPVVGKGLGTVGVVERSPRDHLEQLANLRAVLDY